MTKFTYEYCTSEIFILLKYDFEINALSITLFFDIKYFQETK